MLSFLVAIFTFVQFNCENFFDCRPDSLGRDTEYLPGSERNWTPWRYWRKIDNVGKTILSCGDDYTGSVVPDIVALCEIEGDSVLHDLTRRSVLYNARYKYISSGQPDSRGMDVALLYHDLTFRPLSQATIRVNNAGENGPSRSILYVCGQSLANDTLHLFVVHAPSRRDGERASRPRRMAVMERLCLSVDSIRSLNDKANIVVMGDFNAYNGEQPMTYVAEHGLYDVTAEAKGQRGAKATYRYKGLWGSLDHILMSEPLVGNVVSASINDAAFLTEDDPIYGGIRPRRTYNGYRFQPGGISDHLPLVVRIRIGKP